MPMDDRSKFVENRGSQRQPMHEARFGMGEKAEFCEEICRRDLGERIGLEQLRAYAEDAREPSQRRHETRECGGYGGMWYRWI